MRRPAVRPRGTARRFLVGPLAILAMVAIIIAGPIVLLSLADNPLPAQLPTVDTVAHRLRQPDDGGLLLWMLTVAGWVAWAIMAGSLLVEFAAQLSGRRAPTILGAPQRLANLLVAAALASMSASGVSHADAAYLESAQVVTAIGPERPVTVATVTANTGPSPMVHQVDRGDWMWHVAGRYLGDEQRYPEIAALNPHLAQQYPKFPDHIRPGDQLRLPADAHDRGARPHATGQASGGQVSEGEVSGDQATGGQVSEGEVSGDQATGGGSSEGATSGGGASGSEAGPPQAAPAAVPATPPYPDDPDRQGTPALTGEDSYLEPDSVSTTASPALAGGVLASVLLGAVAWHRARKSAHRRYRRRIATASHAAAETGMRAAAATDADRLDRALRMLAVAMADTRDEAGNDLAATAVDGGAFPDIGAVWITGADIHLVLASPCPRQPPAPFQLFGTGDWVLPADAEVPWATGVLAPLPELVTIASEPGRHLLVDLERLGMLTVSGDVRRCGDLLRHLAAEMAHHPWSDRVEVTLAGFPTEEAEILTSLNPSRVRAATSLPAAVEQLRRRREHTTGTLLAHGLTDSVHGRVADVAADSWTPRLLLVHRPTEADERLLNDLGAQLTATARRSAVAVVTTHGAGGTGGGHRVTVAGDGLLEVSFLAGADDMPAAALPVELLASYAELVRDAAAHDDHPVPPAREAWAAGTDAAGGCLPVTAEAATVLCADTPVLPLPALAGPPARDHAPARPASPASPARPAEPAGDAGLDDAVAAWRRGPRTGVAILGPVRVTAAGPGPAHRPRACQELVVLLAARAAAGVTADEITRLLWPLEAPPAPVRIDVIDSARQWLAGGADGEPCLPDADREGRYRLSAAVPVDWHLFRRLRTRGQRTGRAQDLQTALGLVRGEPFAGAMDTAATTVRPPYSWLAGSAFAPDLIRAGIIDTAHELVEHCLAAGDLSTARWAVEQAWLADPARHDDHPWRDLMRIVHARRDPQRLREVIADLLRWRDLEHPDELTPRTRELIATLLPGPVGIGGRPAHGGTGRPR